MPTTLQHSTSSRPGSVIRSGRAVVALVMVLGPLGTNAVTADALSSGVTVAASPAAAPAIVTTARGLADGRRLAADSMTRNVGGGWGVATAGGAYALSGQARFGVDGHSGWMSVPKAGKTATALLSKVQRTDVRAQVSVALGALPTTGGGVYTTVRLRSVGPATYAAQVRVRPGGVVTVSTLRINPDRTTTTLSSPVNAGFSVKPTEWFVLDGQVTGTTAVTINARAWKAGKPRPAWQRSSVDKSAQRLARPGAIGIGTYTSVSSPGAIVRFDNLAVYAVGSVPTLTATTGRPQGDNTGVPAGTSLSRRDGDIHVKTAGTVIDRVDIHGFVFVEAPNVTIKRSIIRGGRATGNTGLIMDYDPKATNLLVEDSELVPAYPSAWIDGIKGGNFTARRVDVHGTVDNIKVHGDNVSVEASWLHGAKWFASDPNQNGGPSHNDGIQVLGGSNVRIVGNTIEEASNSALQVTQDYALVHSLVFDGNWADGGACTVNLSNKGAATMSGVAVRYNRFGRHSRYNCPIIASTATSFTAVGNVWDDTGGAVPIVRRG